MKKTFIKLIQYRFTRALIQCTKYNFNQKYSQQTYDQLKQQAQKFYETQVNPQTSNIIDIQKIEQWQTEVLDSPIPVVLDCYADWCQPCKKLAPILEEKANNSEGKWKLVKINIDKFPQLATALQIKSIPTVYLISNKNSIDGFIGYPEESQLVQFFETVKKIAGLQNNEELYLTKMQEINNLLKNNMFKEANQLIQQTLENNSFIKNQYGAKLISLQAYIQAKLGDKVSCQKYLDELNSKFSQEIKEDQECQQLLSEIDLIIKEISNTQSQNPQLEELLKKTNQDPKNLGLIFELASLQADLQLFEDSIQNLLHILKIDRNWDNKKASKLLIEIFTKLGSSNKLTIEGRKSLQKILY